MPSRHALARVGFRAPSDRTVLRDSATLLQCACSKRLDDDDDAAIQNDVAALGGYEDNPLQTALKSLGLLIPTHSSLRSHHGFARRSPRGPPAFS